VKTILAALVLAASMGIAKDTLKQTAPTIRPSFEPPAELSAEYFRQAWVIEHAMSRQGDAARKIQAACAKDLAEAKMTRGEDGELRWLCVPTPPASDKEKK